MPRHEYLALDRPSFPLCQVHDIQNSYWREEEESVLRNQFFQEIHITVLWLTDGLLEKNRL